MQSLSDMIAPVVEDKNASQPRLPVEIFERIIGFGSTEDLLTCAQVCKTFYPLSRYLSLRDVYLKSQQHTYRLSQLLRGNPTLGQAIESVSILGSPGSGHNDTAHLVTFATTCASLVPNLRSLTLRDVKWAGGSLRRDVCLYLTRLRKVTELTLENVELSSAAAFAALLCALPALDLLRCAKVRLRNSGFRHLAFRRPPARRRFKFRVCTDDIAAPALRLVIADALRIVDMFSFFMTLDVDGPLTHIAGSGIRSLLQVYDMCLLVRLSLNLDHCGVEPQQALQVVEHHFSLAPLECLDSILITIIIGAEEVSGFDFACFAALLASVTSGISCIQVVVKVVGEGIGDGVRLMRLLLSGAATTDNMTKIDRIVSSPPFTRESRIWISSTLCMTRAQPGFKEWIRTVQHKMPTLHANKQLDLY
ncbi:uncharacterized protein B0H18DRAFT_4860 [Fomitopsis serialis]|uniref:uncharacterized protein n=1 Tax=Fomitopsis serialis TaxID=139415 RepID=UPI0020073F75|nr:uncharacterized protein B0H18DRAFT_4860 [Neoantrodia serialis]KAH9938138.1 hypothetical protein B0H18DRAFT_4860 [Neoantrodia serialis]